MLTFPLAPEHGARLLLLAAMRAGTFRRLNCGTGAGGFQLGNTCAKDGSGESASASFKVPENFKLKDAEYDVNTRFPLNKMVVASVDLDLLTSPYPNDWRVQQMVGAIEQGTKFPPITIEQYPDRLIILDGNTRIAAFREAGIKGSVPAVIRLYGDGSPLPKGVVIDKKRTTSLRSSKLRPLAMRAGTFNPDQARDEAGQWTTDGDSAVSALDLYKTVGYVNVNRRLREGTTGSSKDDIKAEKLTTKLDREMKPLKEGATVYRAIEHAALARNPKALVGRELDSPAFMSTSPDERLISDVWMRGANRIGLKLEVPKGTKAVRLDKFGSLDEPEILLDRGLKIKITGFYEKDGQSWLTGSVVKKSGYRIAAFHPESAIHRAAEFNPDQPRDEQGQWTSGGVIIGVVDSRGSVEATKQLKQSDYHNEIFPGHNRPASQRFAVHKGDVRWNEEPSADDYFAVDDYLAKMGVVVKKHTVIDRFAPSGVRVIHPPAPKMLARHPESALHRAADRHVARLAVAVRYAFARGREKVNKDLLRKAVAARENLGEIVMPAANAVASALRDVLPGTLREVLKSGGDVAAIVLRTAEFNPDQPRDEQGQWTSEGHKTDLETGYPETKGLPSSIQTFSSEVQRWDDIHVVGNTYKKNPIPLDATPLSKEEKELVEEMTEGKYAVILAPRDKVVTRQTWVDGPKLVRMTGKNSTTLSEKDRVSTAILRGNKVVVLDGNHRAVLQYATGAAKIELRIPSRQWRDLRAAEFNPDQPRDEQGQWAGSGSLYHGTAKRAADSIKANGFKLSSTRGEAGIFASHDENLALSYAAQRTLNEKSKIPLERRTVAVLEVDAGGFERRTSETSNMGFHLEWTSSKDIPASAIRSVRLYKYADVVKNGRVVHDAKPFKVLEDVLFVGVSQEELVHLGDEELRTAKGPQDATALKFKFNAQDQRAVDWADRHAAELVTRVSETTRQDINNTIAELLESGDWESAYDDLLAAVGDEARATLIARNETMTAVSEGQRQAWGQAVDEGLLTGDERRVWIVVGDENVCPECEALDGTFADLDGEYANRVEGPPAHVACRCTEGIA